MASCIEAFGDKVETTIGGAFGRLGKFVGSKPRKTIGLAIVLTVLCGVGFLRWSTENRGEELWVPQDTDAEDETDRYQAYFAADARFNTMIIEASNGGNVLTKDTLVDAMKMHNQIATVVSTTDGMDYTLTDLCVPAGGSCLSGVAGVCGCRMTSILRQWNYDLPTLQADSDVLQTINNYGSQQDLEAVLGNPTFDSTGTLLSAGAFTLSYFLTDRSVVTDGTETDPVNESWEEDAFLTTAESVPTNYPSIGVFYFAGRSFQDEFGDAITGDLSLVQISYVAAFLFLGATLGRIKCGNKSRWTMALAALVTVGLSTAAGFGISSAFGLFFGPVHSLLPFILLGIGVDDAFVIVNAFNRERKGPKSGETNQDLVGRCSRGLARAGASITVTSLTDLVAFAISSSSALPALASFCAYAAISIFFLWLFASTFFSATLVLDERRQRDNRWECVCCMGGKNYTDEDESDEYQEDLVSRYFRNFHAPAILSKVGKVVVLIVFAGLLGFGVYGAMNLSVEDSERNFIPAGSYLGDYFDKSDEYFPSQGIDVFFIFENSGSATIYEKREELASLNNRLSGLSTAPPYISEPVSEEAYRNVMTGLSQYLQTSGTGAIGGATLGSDSWPTTEADFVSTLAEYASPRGPGAIYARDVSFASNNTVLEAITVQCEYVRLTKLNRGEIIDDADKQIDAMDATRDMVATWTDLPMSFPYSAKFISIEGFKIIRRELFLNVGLAVGAVGIIVLVTVASPVTAILITVAVAACIIEILGFMFALGIVIDSVSVINIVLAVGLSVDYSAHIGHCFMTKGGTDKNARVKEALADIGAAVLSGAISTFLAVAVLLFSSSYVFQVLSRQFALTVGLGISHGLVLLPVLLSIVGPAPFSSADTPKEIEDGDGDYATGVDQDAVDENTDGKN